MATLGKFRAVARDLPDQVPVVVRDHHQEMTTLGQFRAVIDGLPDEVPLEVAIRDRWHFNALLGDLPVTGVTVRVIQNSVTKIANGPLTCADSGGEMPAEGVLNNPR